MGTEGMGGTRGVSVELLLIIFIIIIIVTYLHTFHPFSTAYAAPRDNNGIRDAEWKDLAATVSKCTALLFLLPSARGLLTRKEAVQERKGRRK